SGLLQAIDLDNEPGAGLKSIGSAAGASLDTVALPLADATIATDATKTAICISPYAYSIGADDATSVYYPLNDAGYDVTLVTNNTEDQANVSIDTFKNLGHYGAVVISTHGGLLPTAGSVID